MTPTDIAKKESAQALAGWFKTYKLPSEQFQGEGYNALVLCAIDSICAFKDGEGATEDEVVAFVEGIKLMLTQEACLGLLRDGLVAATVQNGELAFAHAFPTT